MQMRGTVEWKELLWRVTHVAERILTVIQPQFGRPVPFLSVDFAEVR